MEEEELTFKIRACAYEVFRLLGAGFLKLVYHQALLKKFQDCGQKARGRWKSLTRERRSDCMSPISWWRPASSWN